jgi:hypothetical protein
VLLADALAFGVEKNEARRHCRRNTFEMAFWAQALWKPDGSGFDEDSARETVKVEGGQANHVD